MAFVVSRSAVHTASKRAWQENATLPSESLGKKEFCSGDVDRAFLTGSREEVSREIEGQRETAVN